MGPETLCVLAFACSIGALVCSLVVLIRATPSRVRKAAFSALDVAEETQVGFRAAAARMLTFMDEVIREREAASGDLQEAERKRRQAAAKLSKLGNGKGLTDAPAQPQTLKEILATLPRGDPRRMSLLRATKMGGQVDDHS